MYGNDLEDDNVLDILSSYIDQLAICLSDYPLQGEDNISENINLRHEEEDNSLNHLNIPHEEHNGLNIVNVNDQE